MTFSTNRLNSILSYCQRNNYVLETDKSRFNILYIEGMSLDGSLNNDAPNEFNDLRLLLRGLEVVGIWEATTEPGRRYTRSPMNPQGAARIQFGQYKAWAVGKHGNSEPHEALVQVAPVIVCRDLNQDFIRTGDRQTKGLYGINQHWGYDLPKGDIGLASAGCCVGRSRQGHREFMALIKKDARYLENKGFVFTTTILPGDKL